MYSQPFRPTSDLTLETGIRSIYCELVQLKNYDYNLKKQIF